MSSRIGPAFYRLKQDGRIALIAYLTAGYPNVESTPGLVAAVADAGADMVELGIPFSDPLADGKTIQATSQAALMGGITVVGALEAGSRARRLVTIPLLFMTYLNPILSFGLARFCKEAAGAGIDGLIVPDLPPEEAAELRASALAEGLDLVFFVSPTSSAHRIDAACQAATGFIYCIAVTGTTGARTALDPAVIPLIDRIRERTDLPVVVGFGLSRREHIAALEGRADGAIVASALLDAIRNAPADPARAATAFIRGLR